MSTFQGNGLKLNVYVCVEAGQKLHVSQYLVCDYCCVILHQPQIAIDGVTEILLEAVTTQTPSHLRDHAPA